AAAAGVVMLVACANLSNLLLARGQTRRKEMAIRSTLGADRFRLIRQLTVESLVLAGCGGLLGVAFAYGVTQAVANTTAVSIPMLSSVSIDGLTLLFTLGVTILAGLLMGIVPALQFSQAREAEVINDSSRGSTEGKRSAALREGLVVGEVGLACVLLVAGGLLLRSFLSVLDVDLGFQPAGAVAWEVETNRSFDSLSERTAFYYEMLDRVEALPGVDAAGFTDTPPLGRNRSWGIRALGVEYAEGEAPSAFPRIVDWRYLQVMDIPLVAGRHFSVDDHSESPQVVVLNETAVETLFPGQDPIGQSIVTAGGEWEVIGVVGNVRHQSLEESSGLEMYLPMTQMGYYGSLVMVVRSPLTVGTLAGSVRSALQDADPMMPTGDFWTMESVVDRSVSPRRFTLILVAAFAGTALLLAALGIYAVLSFSVSQRIPEIGIRMALGESPATMLRRVVGRTMVLAGTGVAIGAAGSLAVSRVMQSLLYGIGSTDVPSFAAMALILLGVSAVAGFLPARRAATTDPIEALRVG
ncbi:MAG: FtsX-like permease family protein, partial [Gemmatimonadota bacterium]